MDKIFKKLYKTLFVEINSLHNGNLLDANNVRQMIELTNALDCISTSRLKDVQVIKLINKYG